MNRAIADALAAAPERGVQEDVMVLNMGPSHPAMHGTVRMVLTLDGETVIKCDPEIGYLHRGFEKQCENATWSQVFPYTDRLNYCSPLLNNFGYALAVEKMLGIKATDRCNYIRTILGEMARLADHFTSLGAGALELGAMSAFLYAVEARDHIWDLVEEVTGARLTVSFARIGGLKEDLPDNFAERWEATEPRLWDVIKKLDQLSTKNRIFMDRMMNTGTIGADEAISLGFTGPVLRSTGVAYDIRKDSPYFAYDRVDFEVPVGTNGDNYDRYLVRLEEMKQSISIIRQCLKGLPGGPLNVDDPHIMLPPKELVYNSIEGMINHFKLIFEGIQVPAGEVYSYTEAANGELGFYIVSNGTGKPYKLRVRPPCFYFMGGIDRMIEGGMLSDIIPTFDTINMIGGEVDR
ncbi:MAG: NADH dehydrogenase (quinone) subunit D [Deltaproteobacteria bacterium]|nr:NADH dehydrogenase (quinone) subunit D [Deltaproteobacteria bacterium]